MFTAMNLKASQEEICEVPACLYCTLKTASSKPPLKSYIKLDTCLLTHMYVLVCLTVTLVINTIIASGCVKVHIGWLSHTMSSHSMKQLANYHKTSAGVYDSQLDRVLFNYTSIIRGVLQQRTSSDQ